MRKREPRAERPAAFFFLRLSWSGDWVRRGVRSGDAGAMRWMVRVR